MYALVDEYPSAIQRSFKIYLIFEVNAPRFIPASSFKTFCPFQQQKHTCFHATLIEFTKT